MKNVCKQSNIQKNSPKVQVVEQIVILRWCIQMCIGDKKGAGCRVKKDANEGVIILYIYVDDLLITSNDEDYITKLKGELMKEFEMTDLDHMTYFLGIEFHKSKKGLLMHQRRYALEILKKNIKWNIVTLSLLMLSQGCRCQRMNMSSILIQLSIEG